MWRGKESQLFGLSVGSIPTSDSETAPPSSSPPIFSPSGLGGFLKSPHILQKSFSTWIFTFYGKISFSSSLPKTSLLVFKSDYVFIFKYIFSIVLRLCNEKEKLQNILGSPSLSEQTLETLLSFFSKSTGNSVAFIYYKELSLYSIRDIFQLLESILHYRDVLVKKEIFEECQGLSWQKSTVNRGLTQRDLRMQFLRRMTLSEEAWFCVCQHCVYVCLIERFHLQFHVNQ